MPTEISDVTLEIESAKIKVEVAGKIFYLICDKDSPLGALHDALMKIKGWCVNRMIENQKAEAANAEAVKEQDAQKLEESNHEA